MTMTTVEQVFRSPKLVYTLLIGVFLFIVVIDAGTTWYFVENHPVGINAEGNPFVKMIISAYGWDYMMLIKVVQFLGLAMFAIYYVQKQKRVPVVNAVLIIMLAIGIGVQVHNLHFIDSFL